jgi:hypothetical protein
MTLHDRHMNLHDAVKAFNQRAAREKWYYYCDPALTFSDSHYDALLGLWRTKAAGRPMPRRSDFTPRDLKDVLRNIVIFERIEQNPSHYRVRLIGTGLTDLAGDRTGKLIDEVVPPDHAARWVECFELILAVGQPLRFLGRVHLKGREYLDAENLFVPLADNNDEPTFAMGLCRHSPRRTHDDQSWEARIASISGALL